MPLDECSATTVMTESSIAATDLFLRIAAGDESAVETLYGVIGRAVRAKVRKEFPSDFEDAHHNVFIEVIAAIRRGAIREPAALFGFIRTFVARRAFDLIDRKIEDRRRHTDLVESPSNTLRPDEMYLEQERSQRALLALNCLTPLQRTIVADFYFEDRSREEIMERNDLTETQFRLTKSRAVSRMRQHTAESALGSVSQLSTKAV